MMMKKVAALFLVMFLCLGAGLSFAGYGGGHGGGCNWEDTGSIHLTPACWDVYMPPDGGAAGIYMAINWFYIQNRDDNEVNFYIDFYNGLGEIIGRIPEEGTRSLAGHAGTRVSPTQELDFPVNTWCSPVVKWSGYNIDFSPTCVGKIQFFDIDGMFVHSEWGVAYDDNAIN
ncbi:MAG: hypothetical protein JEZ02_01395 [Desulfatibacillum sp.]|nr:hypothetical protein [Desulfatibacillum sp.]